MNSCQGKLIIVCGLPGSGKTTMAKRIEKVAQAIRFCPDEWMMDLSIDLYDEVTRSKIEELQWQLAQQLLMQGLTVIIEWGTWAKAERDRLRLKARALGAKVELYYLSAPLEVLFKRIQERGMENPPLTKEDITRWLQDFEEPDNDEKQLFDHYLLIDSIL